MGGGLMQLVAYGAQDVYLTGNPQITFFKVVYRRHTNFSMESIQQTISGTANFGNRVSTTISRNGDLVGKMYLQFDNFTVPAQGANLGIDIAPNLGTSLINEVEVEIGGQSIDKHSGQFLETWAQLTQPNSGACSNAAYLTANLPATQTNSVYTNMSLSGGCSFQRGGNNAAVSINTFYVPLQFWFNRHTGLALPLIALQYHEVKINLTFNNTTGIINQETLNAANTQTITNATMNPTLWADYIYLDTDERRRFAQVSHEYLIEQVQQQNLGNGTSLGSFTVNFNHPVKELIFSGASAGSTLETPQVRGNAGAGANGTLQASPSTPLQISTNSDTTTLQLKLNGHDRFAARNLGYFTRTQVSEYHSGCGGLRPTTAIGNIQTNEDSIGVYSFALKPEEHQPSGSCNFSRIDNAQIVIGGGQTPAVSIIVYAINYNVLRIMSGMGGLAYSN